MEREDPGRIKGLFFTGTDTGVGKTLVASAVARLLRHQGYPVGVCKPVATGAVQGPDGLLSEDTRQLAEGAGWKGDLKRVTPWAFANPAAPPVAARKHGMALSLQKIAAGVMVWNQSGNVVLVEGIGGLLCPLTDRETVADLAGVLGLPLIVVARRSLGTLNHTLMTLEVAHNRGLPVAGVVVNETEFSPGPASATNVGELERRIQVPILAVVPFAPLERDRLAALSEVDWWQLCFNRPVEP